MMVLLLTVLAAALVVVVATVPLVLTRRLQAEGSSDGFDRRRPSATITPGSDGLPEWTSGQRAARRRP